MHISKLKKYYFIEKYNVHKFNKLDRDISLIWRSKHIENDIRGIEKTAIFCKKHKREFYISNNFKLAIKLNVNGVYISAKNRNMRHNNFIFKKKFKIIGSIHNCRELTFKKNQRVQEIFLAPIFKNKVKFALGLYKTKTLFELFRGDKVALGGISKSNLKLLRLNKYSGFAAINYFS